MTAMKNKILLMGLVLFCLNTGSGLFAQNGIYAVSNIDSELLKDAHTVIRYEKMEIHIPSASKSVMKYKSVKTLLNENSHADELVISYDKSFNKIGKIKGKIYDASGKLVRELKKSEFKDRSAVDHSTMYGDDRYVSVKVSHSDYPYTVELEYKKTEKKFMYYPYWAIQGYKTSVEKSFLIVDVFNGNQLGYKSLNIDLEPKIKKDGDNHEYAWEVTNRKAIKGEAVSPSWNKILPMILLTPSEFNLGEYRGTMTSWNAYGKFMNELNKGRDELTEQMKKKVYEITANARSDREKINILYKYLQENTRYVGVQLGIGGWQTFSAKYVSENEYGDCKALTNYMKSMLKEVGIVSYPVLTNRGASHNLIQEEFVAPYFNHVILNIPSEDYWLECTSSDHPPNYLGSDNENKTAFRYTESGGELVKTPDYKAEQNQEKNNAIITLLATGDAHLSNEILYTGTQQERYRSSKFYLSQEDLEKKFLESESLPSFAINKYEIRVNEIKPEATETYDIDIKRYATKGGKRLFVPLNLINAISYVPPSTEKRIHPLEIRSDMFDEDQTTFKLPEGYEIESMPEPTFTLETDFGFYKVDLKVEGNQLIYNRKLKLTPGEYPAERYEDYRNFRKEIGTRDSIKLVLVKKKT